MQPKVLFVRSDVKLAGPGKLMLASASALKEVGAEVLIATSGGALVPEFEKAGFRHFEIQGLKVGGRSIGGTLKASRDLMRITREQKISVIHSFNATAGLAAVPAAWRARIPLFNTVLGYGKEALIKYLPFKIVAVSQFTSEALQKAGVHPNKIKVIYNSTLDDTFIIKHRDEFDGLWKARESLKPFTFIGVAMFTGTKGQSQILEATKVYLDTYPDAPIRVVLVGDGILRPKMEEYARQLGIEDHVEFTGASHQIRANMDAAHAFIHLAEFETFGIVVAEANARGLPVVASNVGGIPEVMQDQKTGFLVDQEKPLDVAHAMYHLVSDMERVKKMGWAGAQRAGHKFSQQQMARDLLALYRGG